jgi:putative transposase
MLSSLILRSGCPWRVLPHDFPPWPTVYHHFRNFQLSGVWHLVFKALHTAERKRVSKDPELSAAIIDSQSVKKTEEGTRSNGYDAHKNIKGRKRHLLVDTWVFRSRFTLHPQTSTTAKERVAFWLA